MVLGRNGCRSITKQKDKVKKNKMAFTKEGVRTPIAIGGIEVRLFSPDPTGTEIAGAMFSVQVKMSDGSVKVLEGDLLPHLTAARKTSLNTFMTDLRAQAITEILP